MFLMLYQFEVSGFKSFNEKFSFRLDGAKEYSFNREAVRNDVIKTGIVYGVNGIGKSNLGLALFDIIFHITQGFESNSAYTSNYLNLESKNDYAEFSYLFRFDEHYLKYTYRKKSLKEILFEEIQIDGETVASINKVESGTMFCSLSGADTLKTDLSETNIKSIVSYINTNAALDHKDSKNKTFQKFIEFVEKMLFFRSIEGNRYMGYEPEPRAISIDIIENGNLEDFEDFLNKAGISCKLCSIDKEDGLLGSIRASAQVISYEADEDSASLVFIDEFDSFYHHELSAAVVEQLKKIKSQVILTTHNVSVMSNEILRPDCYFVMSKTEVSPLYLKTSKELREAHNLGKMYKAGSFNG